MGRGPAGQVRHTVNRLDSSNQRLGVGLGLGAAAALGLAIAVSRFAYDGGTDGLTLSATRASLMALGVLLFVRERVTALRLGCLMSAFFGLSLMLSVSFISIDIRGVGLALTAAVCCAWHAVWLSRRTLHLDPFVVTAYMSVVAALVLLGLNLVTGGFDWPRSGVGWAGFTGVVLLQGSAVPAYFIAIGMIGALKSGMITNLQPVVSIVAAFVLFGETLTPVQLIGGAMVLTGVWVMQWSDTRALAARI